MIICKRNKGIWDRQTCKISALQCWSTFSVQNYASRNLCMYRKGIDWRMPGQPGSSHSNAHGLWTTPWGCTCSIFTSQMQL